MALGLRVSLVASIVLYAVAGHAQPEFPPLEGRVVDRAQLLTTGVESQLTRLLKAHEDATSEQVVVVTLPDLQGYSIEEFGYQLGRHWGIGQEGKDNGALLIVAQDERKVRIEVGYGLEGRLTDAQSSVIINQVIVPAFREGDFAAGIVRGVEAIVQVLGGDPLQAQPTQSQRSSDEKPSVPLAMVFLVMMIVVANFVRGGRRRRDSGLLGGLLLGSALGHGRSGGGFGGGGGFSGGGGGFGGGGASGGW